jgi:CRISPR-associated exonuclease Cas4
MAQELEPLPLSALNHLMYCERRCALIHIEGVFEENAFTLQGSLLHETADTPGYSTQSGVRVVRALPLYSRLLGLSGKADIVEFSAWDRWTGNALSHRLQAGRTPSLG